MSTTQKEPRNPDITMKPNVVTWFKKNPGAKKHFEPVRSFLEEHYRKNCDHRTSRSSYGYIDKKSQPVYKFGFKQGEQKSMTLRCSLHHTSVIFHIPAEKISTPLPGDRKMVRDQNNIPFEKLTLKISNNQGLRELSDVLRIVNLSNFYKPKPGVWRKFPIDEQKTVTIRTGQGYDIEVSQNELELQERFFKWLKGKKVTESHRECIRGDRDRIDIKFELEGSIVFAELKSVVNRSGTKGAIREALGQVLDYQYYSGESEADQLWIVVDDVCTDKDKRFIDTLVNNHRIPLRVAWQNSPNRNQFGVYPDLSGNKP